MFIHKKRYAPQSTVHIFQISSAYNIKIHVLNDILIDDQTLREELTYTGNATLTASQAITHCHMFLGCRQHPRCKFLPSIMAGSTLLHPEATPNPVNEFRSFQAAETRT